MPAARFVSAPPTGAGAETVHCWQRTERARRESIARARQHEPVAAYSAANNVTQQSWSRIVAAVVKLALISFVVLPAALAGCGDSATLPLAAGTAVERPAAVGEDDLVAVGGEPVGVDEGSDHGRNRRTVRRLVAAVGEIPLLEGIAPGAASVGPRPA